MITISTKKGIEPEYHLKKTIDIPGDGFTMPDGMIFECEKNNCSAFSAVMQAMFKHVRSITILPGALTRDGLRLGLYESMAGPKPIGLFKKGARCALQKDERMKVSRVVCASKKFFDTDKWQPIIKE
jgi:hypothetical protein